MFNEQIIGPNSITVNAAHMYLLGGTARGDMVVGSSTCSLSSTTANGAPVATDDAFATDEDTPITVGGTGLLANDTDPDGNPLTATNSPAVLSNDTNCCRMYSFPSDPAKGTVALNSDGSFTYTPNANATGTDTFTYTARDARGASDTGLVTITIASLPDDPVAGDDSYRVQEHTPLTVAAPGVLGNDIDGDGDPRTAAAASQPADGTVTLNPDGSFTYTPEVNFVGTDSFTYTVSDGTGRSDTALVTFVVHVNEAAMLKDINPGTGSSSPSSFVQLGDSVYFLAGGPSSGLWKTDGNMGSTVLVKALSGSGLTVMGGSLYLSASDGITGTELWKSDGTEAGTAPVRDINPGSASSSPSNLRVAGSSLYFSASNGTAPGAHGTEVWKSDGTAAGTLMVKDINPGTASANPSGGFTPVGDSVFFSANNGVSGLELWKTDGTEAGTVLVKDIMAGSASGNPERLSAVGNTLLFAARNGTTTGFHGIELWKSDGTEAGTVMVKDINPGTASSNLGNSIVFNGTLLFSATTGNADPGLGIELWSSDGTEAGTVMVRDINMGPSSSQPASFLIVGDAVYFSATSASSGSEFWKTDGTEDGTLMVKDINPGGNGSAPSNFASANGTVYFSASNGTVAPASGTELWKTDGTDAGTVLAKDINPGTVSSSPSLMTPALGTMFFRASTPSTGNEPWHLNPPQEAPVAIDDSFKTFEDLPLSIPAPGVLGNDFEGNGDPMTASSASDPANGAVVLNPNGSFTYTPDANFLGTDSFTYVVTDAEGANDTGLATILVTRDTAQLVKDIVPGNAPSTPTRFAQVGNTLYFTATGNGPPSFGGDGVANGLWKTDGTAAGTQLVKDLLPSNQPILVKDDTIYFQAGALDGSTGFELWKSDGTTAGTAIVKEINPGPAHSLTGSLKVVGGTLFFSATDGTAAGGHGSELWRSDGTEAGTVLVKDINPGTATSSPIGFTPVGSTLFFSASNGTDGGELWKSDGTEAGTVLVKDINPGTADSWPEAGQVIGATAYFSASGTEGRELWKSDGTEAGTVLVKDINVGTGNGEVRNLFVHGSSLLFTASDGASGDELWKSNGTTGGTVMVKDINPGPSPSFVGDFAALNGDVYFVATGTAGVEVWKTDLTSEGTMLLKDIRAGTSSSFPGQLTVLGNTMYFAAHNGINGNELWSTDGTTDGTVMAEDIEPGSVGSNPQSFGHGLGTLYFGALTSAEGTELWRILPPKQTPVATDDAYGTLEDTPLTVPAPGVLGNDTDGNLETLTATSASDPGNGSVTLNGNGSFTYTPDLDFAGTDTFTYTADDGDGGTDTAQVTVTVTDPGPAALSVGSISLNEGNTGATAATFTITRAGDVTAPSTVKYRTNGGNATVDLDYTPVPLTTVTFAAGETSKSVSVDVAGDTLPEANETFNVVLSAPTGATIADATSAATIVNDDGSAYLSVGNVTVTEGNVGATPATFTVSRSGNTNGPSTVKYKTGRSTATEGADYTPVALTDLSFGPGETSKTVTVDVTSDTVDESNENLTLVLSAPTGATIADATGTGYITDDDGRTVTPAASTYHSVGNISVDEGNTGTTAATFTVTRTGNTTGASTVKYRTSGGTATAGVDYTAATLDTLSFAADETTKTVTVEVAGETAPEGNETFNLVLSGATGGVIADAGGSATIVNDDGAAFVSVNNVTVTEGSSGTTTATFIVTRSGNTTAASTVKHKTTNGTAGTADFTAIDLTTLEFAAGETTKTVTVDINSDTLNEIDERFTLTLSGPTGASIADAAGIATIIDDD